MKISPSLFTALFSIGMFLLPANVQAETGPVRARVTQPVDMQNLVTLRGNTHPLARTEYDQGVAPDNLAMSRMLLVLQRGKDQESALRQLLDDQQMKSSSRFHQWLTPEQFGEQFGPADADIQAIIDWLTTQGFLVTKVAAGRTVIEFSGTAGLVRQVLGTEIHRYRVNGEDHWANTSDPQIPAALEPVVAGFASLNNFPRKPMHQSLGTFSRSKATGKVQPLFTYEVSGGYYLAVGPTDFATIYNVLPLWNAGTDGSGQTIAVVGETNINIQDVRDFRNMFGLPAKDPIIILNGPDPGINGEEVEADLNVQWSGAVAKGATIDLVVSESTEASAGIDLSALYIVDNNLAPVMSESYGSCEASLGVGGNQFYNTLWEQAAAQGITVLLAAGDSGSAGCDSAIAGETIARYGLAVSGLASTPFNVAVGGTDFNDANNPTTYWSLTNTLPSQSSVKSYIPESTWNDSCAASGSLTGCSPPPNSDYLSQGFYLVAGGGGPSSCINPTGTFPSVTCSGSYPKPSWQSGLGVPNDGARDIPDVSLFAGNGLNYSFYVICQMDANASAGGDSSSCDLNSPYTDFQGGSGTSASTQTFAGIMALVNQRYGRQGNANYVLYPMAAKSGASCNSNPANVTNSSCVFYDVTVGNNSVICLLGSPNCSSAPTQYGIMISGNPAAAAYPATPGYDLATGLGSVNVANLINNWTSVSFTASTTTLSLSTNPATNPISLTHGQPINFTIQVISGSGTPAGDVSLIAQTSTSQSTGIGPFTLGGGSVSGATVMLPGGNYTVTAHYAGNGTFAASDSSPGIQVTVGKESSLTSAELVTFNANTGAPSYGVTTTPYGSPYALRMNVTNSSGQPCASPVTGLIAYPCPTGALTVSPAPTDENPPPGTVPGHYALNSQGYAEDIPIQLLPGTYPFVASYTGDNSYNSSISPSIPITITQAPTTIGITAPASVAGPNEVSLTATITTLSNGVGPTGTVQFFNAGTPIGSTMPVTGTPYAIASGAFATAQATVQTFLAVGTYMLTVQYSGDGNYLGSTSPPAYLNVTDFTETANPSSITIPVSGQGGTSTITLTPVNDFFGTVNLNVASICPMGTTCMVSPSSVYLAGIPPATATFSITTTANVSPRLPNPQPRVPPGFSLPFGWVWWLAGLVALAMLLGLATAQHSRVGWVFVAAVLVVGVWAACGGGGGGGVSPPPPPTPAISFSPPNLTFGAQRVGTTSAGQTVTVTNTGNAVLNIVTMGIGGTNPLDFSQTTTCGNSLAASANCVINVTFTPTAQGARSAAIDFNDNAGVGSQTYSLSGTATPPTTPPGTYPIQINAVSGNDEHTLTISVTVQ